MGKSKKIDLVALIVFGVLVVAIVLAVVGVCITWTSYTGLTNKVVTETLGDLAEQNQNAIKLTKESLEGFNVMQAFAYITLAMTILTAIAFVVSKFVDIKVLKWVVIGIAALTVISAIVSIATTCGFCDKDFSELLGRTPAAGPWLLFVFSVIGSGAAIGGSLKK